MKKFKYGGGGGVQQQHGKSKARYFLKQNPNSKKRFIEVGQRGFLATCNLRPGDCVRECYNILNQFYNEENGGAAADGAVAVVNETKNIDIEAGEPLEAQKNPTEKVAEVKETETNATKETATTHNTNTDADGDILDELDVAIAATASSPRKHKSSSSVPQQQQRFQALDTGVTNCLFIESTVANPTALGAKIVQAIARGERRCVRFLLRLWPVEVVCRAKVEDIMEAAGPLFDRYFKDFVGTFGIVFNRRCNQALSRDDVIQQLAALVADRNAGIRVDLKEPKRIVLVEVIKGLCCLSVLDDYHQYKKYNLAELLGGEQKTDVGSAEKAEMDVTPEAEVETDPEPEAKAKEAEMATKAETE